MEYDVREDLPEETNVYSLEPASDLVIERLILSRFGFISEPTARVISKLSGGNFRIAIAIASTIKEGGNTASLKDEELFKRLFIQRHGSDSSLERSAEVLSILYSFNFKGELGTESEELMFLNKLSGIKADDLYVVA